MAAEVRALDNHNDDTLGRPSGKKAAHPATPLAVTVAKDDNDGTEKKKKKLCTLWPIAKTRLHFL